MAASFSTWGVPPVGGPSVEVAIEIWRVSPIQPGDGAVPRPRGFARYTKLGTARSFSVRHPMTLMSSASSPSIRTCDSLPCL